MPALSTHLNARSEEFKANAAAMRLLVDDLNAKLEKIVLGGRATTRLRAPVARGKLLPRDRVRLLLDPGTPFLEIAPLAALGMYPEKGGQDAAPGAGMIAGIGRVAGVECLIVRNDATVKGGTYYPLTVKKAPARAGRSRRRTACACIYTRLTLGGANLPNQDEVFPDRDHFGRIFFNQANLSAAGIPQLAVVMGSCTRRRAAYVPAMSDQTIIVKNQGTIFLGRGCAAGEGGDLVRW